MIHHRLEFIHHRQEFIPPPPEIHSTLHGIDHPPVVSDFLSVVDKFDTVVNDFIPVKNDLFLVVNHFLVKGNDFFREVNKCPWGNVNKLPGPNFPNFHVGEINYHSFSFH